MLQAKTQNERQLQQTAGDSRPFNNFYCLRVKICKSVSLSTLEIREKKAANTLARTTDKLQRISEENIRQGEKYQIRCVKQYGKITQELLSQQIQRPCNPNDCNSGLEHLLITVCLLHFYFLLYIPLRIKHMKRTYYDSLVNLSRIWTVMSGEWYSTIG